MPTRPRLSVQQAGWSASARGAGCSLPRPEGLMHFMENPQLRRGPHPSPAPAARRPESPTVATGQGKDVFVVFRRVCPRAEAWTGLASARTTVLVSHRRTLAAGTPHAGKGAVSGLTCVRGTFAPWGGKETRGPLPS